MVKRRMIAVMRTRSVGGRRTAMKKLAKHASAARTTRRSVGWILVGRS